MKLFIAGEGVGELGAWADGPAYRPASAGSSKIGAIEAFAARVHATEPQVVGAELWKSVYKYRAGDHASAEARTVMGLALKASEANVDALVFLRDRDGDVARAYDVEDGVARARALFPTLPLACGIPIEELESWILTLLGDGRAESRSDPKNHLRETQPEHASREGMVNVIAKADFRGVPEGASSLHSWLDALARLALP